MYAVLLAALLGQPDYSLAPQVHDYAFAPLLAEQLAVVLPVKRTEPTPTKCPGGVCMATPKPQAIRTKSVLVESQAESVTAQQNQSTGRRALWRPRLLHFRR